MKKAIFTLLLLSFMAFPARTLAVDVPNFPTCSNPEGVLKVSFDTGIHGIPGNPGQFTGSDKVYTVDEARTVQCFCSTDGSGIQTNWWKVSSLTQDQIQELKNLGWVFIPTGAPWGLKDDPYMALNINYSCQSSNNNNSNSNGNSSSGSVSSSASSTSSNPQVLGLAYTGDASELLILSVTSATSLILGVFTRRKKV